MIQVGFSLGLLSPQPFLTLGTSPPKLSEISSFCQYLAGYFCVLVRLFVVVLFFSPPIFDWIYFLLVSLFVVVLFLSPPIFEWGQTEDFVLANLEMSEGIPQ